MRIFRNASKDRNYRMPTAINHERYEKPLDLTETTKTPLYLNSYWIRLNNCIKLQKYLSFFFRKISFKYKNKCPYNIIFNTRKFE